MKGKIYSINAGMYYINDELGKIHILPAAGLLRYKNITPLVGDYVNFEENKHLMDICDRKNSLIRPKVANVDYVLTVMSAKEPDFSTYLIDKYMAYIELNSIEPILLITKCDLTEESYKEVYEKMGYKVYEINYKIDEWDKNIKELFNNKTIVLMGQSGVGKTTFLNHITNNNFATQDISRSLNRGKHTTRVIQIVKAFNGELIDTPGFSSLDINFTRFTKIDFAKSYKQFKELSKTCKFKSCLHQNEPLEFCNIKQAVKKDIIPQFRYDNYLKLLKEFKND